MDSAPFAQPPPPPAHKQFGNYATVVPAPPLPPKQKSMFLSSVSAHAKAAAKVAALSSSRSVAATTLHQQHNHNHNHIQRRPSPPWSPSSANSDGYSSSSASSSSSDDERHASEAEHLKRTMRAKRRRSRLDRIHRDELHAEGLIERLAQSLVQFTSDACAQNYTQSPQTLLVSLYCCIMLEISATHAADPLYTLLTAPVLPSHFRKLTTDEERIFAAQQMAMHIASFHVCQLIQRIQHLPSLDMLKRTIFNKDCLLKPPYNSDEQQAAMPTSEFAAMFINDQAGSTPFASPTSVEAAVAATAIYEPGYDQHDNSESTSSASAGPAAAVAAAAAALSEQQEQDRLTHFLRREIITQVSKTRMTFATARWTFDAQMLDDMFFRAVKLFVLIRHTNPTAHLFFPQHGELYSPQYMERINPVNNREFARKVMFAALPGLIEDEFMPDGGFDERVLVKAKVWVWNGGKSSRSGDIGAGAGRHSMRNGSKRSRSKRGVAMRSSTPTTTSSAATANVMATRGGAMLTAAGQVAPPPATIDATGRYQPSHHATAHHHLVTTPPLTPTKQKRPPKTFQWPWRSSASAAEKPTAVDSLESQ
ncbi:hypothetical protein RI367_003611 [Sorochytrium milnesiophthora]